MRFTIVVYFWLFGPKLFKSHTKFFILLYVIYSKNLLTSLRLHVFKKKSILFSIKKPTLFFGRLSEYFIYILSHEPTPDGQSLI